MLNVTAEQRALGLPFIRLHDCHWPNPDVVDIHAVFPNPNADAENPSSYDFAQSDDYLQAAAQTGAKLIYRLGESIEHTRVRRFVHPPKDTEHWSKVCLGIIRHYNEGWANGFHMAIPYWEIWNEPNHPNYWSGPNDGLKKYSELLKFAYAAAKGVEWRGMVRRLGAMLDPTRRLADLFQEFDAPFVVFVEALTGTRAAGRSRRVERYRGGAGTSSSGRESSHPEEH